VRVGLITIKIFGVNVSIFLKIQNQLSSREITLKENSSLTFGRGDQSDVKISDRIVSSTHFKMEFNPPKLILTDLQSKNGTYLNGLKIQSAEIYIGDEIRAGETTISISPERMNTDLINLMTFKGNPLERKKPELQLDYTGLYQISINKASKANTNSPPKSSVQLEIETAIPDTKMRKSLDQIKQAHKNRSMLASLIDLLLAMLSFVIPLVIISTRDLFGANIPITYRFVLMLIFVMGSGGFFYFINFRILQFSLGEKIAGLENLFKNQG
jgi:pSer/pThr/pTyr-binding forkhead associated (FHA) protein